MLAEFRTTPGRSSRRPRRERDEVQAEYFARSAINLSRLLMASEPTMRKAIAPLFMLMKQTPPQLPVWQFADRILGAFNDKEASEDFFAAFGGRHGPRKEPWPQGRPASKLVIVDEDSKINVNIGAANEIAHIRLAKEIIGPDGAHAIRLRSSPSATPPDNYSDRLTTCAAIIDWADPDEQLYSCDMTNAPSSNAASRTRTTSSSPKPYRRKNAPYDSLEELHMVRGVTRRFLGDVRRSRTRRTRKKREMTVWGQGAVNVNTANALTLYAIVCSGTAPTSDICSDPAQMQLFVMGVTMGQGITMGAPLFNSPNDFISTMKGQGTLGPLLALMGLKPVKFLSESDFAKSISTESKVFSMYAVGVVKGYRRETRVKIHTVVDFRTAPSLLGGQTGAPPTGSTAAGTTGAGSTSSQEANAIALALQPSVGGQVLFYDIE